MEKKIIDLEKFRQKKNYQHVKGVEPNVRIFHRKLRLSSLTIDQQIQAIRELLQE